jgi:membrane peptidoglycan carboxypeptidase
MAELNVITATKADRQGQQAARPDVTSNRNGCVFSRRRSSATTSSLPLTDPALGKTVEERKKLLESGGLTIKTTIDLRFQRPPTTRSRARLPHRPRHRRPGDGRARHRRRAALAQSRPMGNNAKRGETFLNYVVPKEYGDSGGFQPGSTFKAFVLAAAIQQGIPLTTTFNAPPGG